MGVGEGLGSHRVPARLPQIRGWKPQDCVVSKALVLKVMGLLSSLGREAQAQCYGLERCPQPVQEWGRRLPGPLWHAHEEDILTQNQVPREGPGSSGRSNTIGLAPETVRGGRPPLSLGGYLGRAGHTA